MKEKSGDNKCKSNAQQAEIKNTSNDQMDKDSISTALTALEREMSNRSKIGQIRELYAQIEAAQIAGVNNRKIVGTLSQQGLSLSLKTFEMILYRVRQERRLQAQKGGEVMSIDTSKEERNNAKTKAIAQTSTFSSDEQKHTSSQSRPSMDIDALEESSSTLSFKKMGGLVAEKYLSGARGNTFFRTRKDQTK